MEKPKRNVLWLLLGLGGISLLGWFINAFLPNNLEILLFFFIIITMTLLFFALFIFKTFRHAILITLGILIWLILRFFGLREIYYGILLAAILLSLEVMLRKS